ncbi:hypothetical protein AB1K70_26100 [Bremerella sp. JC770]|uniref:hypothetical protein n=1 Tax=Bremerella sp. JC770 TaxID=3232137 RepID=UPI00345A45C0
MPRSKKKSAQIDLTDAKLAKSFGLGCLNIQGAHLWPVSHFVWDASASLAGATFFCEDLDGWPKTSLLRIEVIRLPKEKDHLADRIRWYTRDRKTRRIRIADGDLFDDSMLLPKAFDETWEQDAFATSKGHVIRIAKHKKFAVIFRFLVQSGSLLGHPIFKRLPKNLSIDTSQWVTDVPEVVEKRKRKSKFTEYSLDDEQESEMWQIVGSVLKRLKLNKVKSISERLPLIEEEITSLRNQKGLTEDEQVDAAIQLGTFVGQHFCWHLDWEWCYLSVSGGEDEYCVCSPDRSMAIAPVDWIYELITNKRCALNCTLTYNMIEAGRLPPSRPGAYKRVG